VLIACAAYVVHFRLGVNDLVTSVGRQEAATPLSEAERRAGTLVDRRRPAHDVYAYFYPNMLYARDRVRDGGRGLFWNPFQNCGQPFFPFSGLVYPPHLLFLVLTGDRALRAGLFFDLVVAGAFAYGLCRELGAGTLAALCGALAFQLGNATVALAAWAPFMVAPYVWIPAAMFFCERSLRAPSVREGVGLAVVLAVALLSAWPQTVFFAYQLVGLRILWEVATRRRGLSRTAILTAGVGLLLAPLLAAVQLAPALEVATASVRNAPLRLQEIAPMGFLDWGRVRFAVALRDGARQPFVLAPCLLAGAALLGASTRRRALFYLLAGVLYFVLALGPNTPVFQAYTKLPLGSVFRDPGRFMWLASFSLAVLTGLGVDAVLLRRRAERWARHAGLAAVGASLAGFWLLAGNGLRPLEWTAAGLALVGGVMASAGTGFRRAAGALLLGALVVNLVAAPPKTWEYLLPSDAPLFAHERVFASVRARMSPQDRVYLSYEDPRALLFGLMQKSASLFGVPSIHDYEPQMARRYAEYFVRMRTGRPMTSLNDVYYYLGGWTPPGFNRRLLDLTAARYLVAAATVDNTAAVMSPPLRRLEDGDDDIRVYENAQALPRASYVPRVEVVADSRVLLDRLAAGRDDPREVALVEAPLPSGFAGEAVDHRPAAVDFVTNDPERVVLRVHAPARGFLFLADQYFPGWQATVDGTPAPIVRANYAFRLVEIPGGASTVEFRYVPQSVRLGAVVSALTLIGVVATLVRTRRRTG
ncbi:MAG: YfhO family protein, partial [Deltaproteobacteria bacterium]